MDEDRYKAFSLLYTAATGLFIISFGLGLLIGVLI